MDVYEILNMMDDLLEKSWSVPLSGGRCVIDVEKFRDLIDDIRLNMPMEVKHAEAIVSDRGDIIQAAKEEADTIIRKAEERARNLITQDEITKKARDKATEILNDAQIQSRQMKKVASEFMERILDSTEQALNTSLSEVKTVKQKLNNNTNTK